LSTTPVDRPALSDAVRAIADNPTRHGFDRAHEVTGERLGAAALAAKLPDTCGDPPNRPEFIGAALNTPKAITRTFRGQAMQSRLEFAVPNVDVREFRQQDETVKLDLGFGEFEVMAEREWVDDTGIAAGGRRSLERTGDVYVTTFQLNEIGRMVLEAAAEHV
jgi:hypothetical protein